MRKGILILGLVVFLLTLLSSFAYSHYKASVLAAEKEICCNEFNKGGETLFESMVKQFVGAVRF